MISAIHPPLTPNNPRARLTHRLEMQSFLIENVLRHYSAEPLTITRGHVDPDTLRYEIPANSDPLPLRAIEHELSERLAMPVRIRRAADCLTISVAHTAPPVGLLQLIATYATPVTRPYTALLGVDKQRQPVWLDLRHSGHVLISGEHGSGKSSLLQTVAATAAAATRPERLQFLMLRDTRDTQLDALNYLPSAYFLHPVISSPIDIVRACQRIQPDDTGQQHLVVLIDNVDRILQVGRIDVLAALSQLLMQRAGVTVVMSTRDGRSDFFRYAGDAFKTRLIGSSAEARTTPSSHPLLGSGDFVLTASQRYFQAAYADPYDLSFILAKLMTSI